jgi:hypothetical protein
MNEVESSCWHEIASLSPRGVLTSADRLAVEIAACLMAEYRIDRSGFGASKLARLNQALGQFGMTPSDRAKLNIEKTKDENPFAALDE